MNSDNIIVITEEYWANSQLSLVRHTGRIRFHGATFVIVNKEGKDIFECSEEAEKLGRAQAIPAGEPADLCREDFVPIYRKLGREKFLKFLAANKDIKTAKEARTRLKTWVDGN